MLDTLLLLLLVVLLGLWLLLVLGGVSLPEEEVKPWAVPGAAGALLAHRVPADAAAWNSVLVASVVYFEGEHLAAQGKMVFEKFEKLRVVSPEVQLAAL